MCFFFVPLMSNRGGEKKVRRPLCKFRSTKKPIVIPHKVKRNPS